MLLESNSIYVAAVQLVSSADVQKNLDRASYWIEKAANQGAKIIALPEYFCFMGYSDQDKNAIAEDFGSGPIQDHLAALAARHKVYIVGGTLPLRSMEANRFYNSCLVYDPSGQCVGRYDKKHLFSFQRGEEVYDESKAIVAGTNGPIVLTTPYGKIGLAICYDLRFPELFRAMGTIDLLLIPSAFTYTTGQAHWEILLRARAIENQCYVLAPAQGGTHDNGRRTWGYSMLVDAWGTIIDSVATGEGCAYGALDHEQMRVVRQNLPALQHKRSDLLIQKDVT